MSAGVSEQNWTQRDVMKRCAMEDNYDGNEPDPVIEAYKAGIDRTLIRENLRLSVEERFKKLMALQKFAEELRRAGRDANKQ
jgi:hypothetical protein